MADADITPRVAAEIRRLRAGQKLSAQKLSERLAQMGVDISRASISAIENGVRPYVTAGELVAFALALNTSPVCLLYPEPETQLDGVRWFCADDTDVVPGMVHDPEQWVGNTRLLRLSRRLDQAKKDLADSEARAAAVAASNPDMVGLLAGAMDNQRKAIRELTERLAEERARR